MSSTDVRDIDVSAAGKEHLELPEGSRKPFHAVLARFLAEEDLSKHTGVSTARYFAERALIPAGHAEIAQGAQLQKQKVPPSEGNAITDLSVIESAAHNEQLRVDGEALRKAASNLVTDADKLAACEQIFAEMDDIARRALHGVSLGTFGFLCSKSEAVMSAQTREEMQRITQAKKMVDLLG